MSSQILQLNANTFGVQSPLKKIVTDNGVRTTMSKVFVNSNSQFSRKRMFDMYLLANTFFPNDTMEINDNIKNGVMELLAPFFKFSPESSVNSIDEINNNIFSFAELKCANSISRVIKTKSIAVIIEDTVEESSISKHGILVYIDKNVKEARSKLTVKWSNGFFQFNDSDQIAITIVIPKPYVKSVMLNIQAATQKELSKEIIPFIEFKNKCINAILIDFVKAFFCAIYTDGHRINFMASIMNFFDICFEQSYNILNKDINGTYNITEIINDLKKQYGDSLTDKFGDQLETSTIRQTIQLASDMNYFNGVTINPFDFYDLFVNIPYTETKKLMNKIPTLNRLINDEFDSNNDTINFNNDQKSLDIFSTTNSDTDILYYCIKLVRYLPFIYFNAYIIGAGSKHGNVVQFINNCKGIISTLNSFKSSNKVYSNIVSFVVDNLNYLINEIFLKISSPQVISTKVREVMVNLLKQLDEIPVVAPIN